MNRNYAWLAMGHEWFVETPDGQTGIVVRVEGYEARVEGVWNPDLKTDWYPVSQLTRFFQKCGLCSEVMHEDDNGFYFEEVGEFWDMDKETNVVGHRSCVSFTVLLTIQ